MSGIPSGSPVGKRGNGAERAPDSVSRIFTEKAEAIAKKAAEQAEAGDVQSMRLVLDRIAPAQKDRAVRFQMPTISGPTDLPAAVLQVTRAVAAGDLTPGEGQQIAAMLEHYRKQTETADLAERITALEEATNAQR